MKRQSMITITPFKAYAIPLFFITVMLVGEIGVYQPAGGFRFDIPTGASSGGLMFIPPAVIFSILFCALCAVLSQGAFHWWKLCILLPVLSVSLVGGTYVFPGLLFPSIYAVFRSLKKKSNSITVSSYALVPYFLYSLVLIYIGSLLLQQGYWGQSNPMYFHGSPLLWVYLLSAGTVVTWLLSVLVLPKPAAVTGYALLLVANLYILGPLSPVLILLLMIIEFRPEPTDTVLAESPQRPDPEEIRAAESLRTENARPPLKRGVKIVAILLTALGALGLAVSFSALGTLILTSLSAEDIHWDGPEIPVSLIWAKSLLDFLLGVALLGTGVGILYRARYAFHSAWVAAFAVIVSLSMTIWFSVIFWPGVPHEEQTRFIFYTALSCLLSAAFLCLLIVTIKKYRSDLCLPKSLSRLI
jgi:hypothetical protein